MQFKSTSIYTFIYNIFVNYFISYLFLWFHGQIATCIIIILLHKSNSLQNWNNKHLKKNL